MILADTSVWVEHLGRKRGRLDELLEAGQVFMHPLIAGEIACGSLYSRAAILGQIDRLPKALECSHAEARSLLERERLYSSGLGYVDVQILASALISQSALWTLDKVLHQAALKLRVAYTPPRH